METQKIEFGEVTKTVQEGDMYKINKELDLNGDNPVSEGVRLKVVNISKYPDGIHFDFEVEGQSGRIECIYKFALENLLEEGALVKLQ